MQSILREYRMESKKKNHYKIIFIKNIIYLYFLRVYLCIIRNKKLILFIMQVRLFKLVFSLSIEFNYIKQFVCASLAVAG